MSLKKEFITHNRIEISRSALLGNLKLLESMTDKPAIPVLKGNAYGHGIGLVAQVLRDTHVPYIAVDGYFEALRIRKVSKQPVLIMGAIMAENYPRLKYNNFAFVVHDAVSIHAIGRTGRRVKVHLEVNTGMNRYGVSDGGVTELTKLILGYPNLKLEGVMSHLADSDGSDPATVDMAVERFDASVDAVRAAGARPKLLHVAQSAGSIKAKSSYANTFRLGIGLYGINPFPSTHELFSKFEDLRPALKLVSTITQVTELKKGDRVGYNYTFTAPKDMRIGVLPLGYYEGISRFLSNVGPVKIGNEYTSIVGRVCMNHTMINLDHISAKVGDEVVVYSNDPSDSNSVDKIADKFGLFNYNLITNLNQDVRRVVVK